VSGGGRSAWRDVAGERGGSGGGRAKVGVTQEYARGCGRPCGAGAGDGVGGLP
jgi:hypothetical protein